MEERRGQAEESVDGWTSGLVVGDREKDKGNGHPLALDALGHSCGRLDEGVFSSS